MKSLYLSAALALTALSTPALAAQSITYTGNGAAVVVVEGPAKPYSEMVHNDAAQTGTDLQLTTKPGEIDVTASSDDTLFAAGENGNGFATISGATDAGFASIIIDPTNPFDYFTAMQFTLTPIGLATSDYRFDVIVTALSGVQTIANILFQTKEDKFDVLGAISMAAGEYIDFVKITGLETQLKGSTTWSPTNFASIRQISFNPIASPTPTPQGVVPEPGTWLLMIIGFGAIGTVLRRRRKVDARGRVLLA